MIFSKFKVIYFEILRIPKIISKSNNSMKKTILIINEKKREKS